jgi:hypothetical protein
VAGRYGPIRRTPLRAKRPAGSRPGGQNPPRTTEPGRAEDDLLALVSENTGTPIRLARAGIRCWACYGDEIDAEIAAVEAAEDTAEDTWRRERQLLAG